MARARKAFTTWFGAEDRKPDPKTGKVRAVGNTVDVKAATYTNSIGATEFLIGQWTDPSFDSQAYTTYYARVLEIPTPRWSTYWAAKLNLPREPKCRSYGSATCLDIAHLVHADETIGVVFRMSEVSVTVAQDEQRLEFRDRDLRVPSLLS